jgi:hypothetical protein
LDVVAQKTLAKRAEDRYESAAQLSADIERYISGKAVKPVMPRGRRWAALAAAVTLLCAAAIWLLDRGGNRAFPPPPFSLAVLPATLTPAAADLREIRESFSLTVFTTLFQTRGLSLVDWREVSTVSGPNAVRDARARLPVAMLLEIQLDRRDGHPLAILNLRRRSDGAVLWSTATPFENPRDSESVASAIVTGKLQPFLEQEFNIAAYQSATGERRQSIVQGSVSAIDPCAERASLLSGITHRDARVHIVVRTHDAHSENARIEVVAGGRRAFPSTVLETRAGTPVPIQAPAMVQLAGDTCVLTSAEGDLPVYADRCIVPPPGETGLFLRYRCVAKAYPIDLSQVANAWSAWNEQTFPSGARILAGAPFLIPEGRMRFWSPLFTEGGSRPVALTLAVHRSGISKAYFLMNTLWGQPGPRSYISLAFSGDRGARFEKKLIGGVDVRNFSGPDPVTSALTREVFNNGRGQHLDVVAVDLPPEFRSQTLDSIVITDTGRADFQRAALWGVTVQ